MLFTAFVFVNCSGGSSNVGEKSIKSLAKALGYYDKIEAFDGGMALVRKDKQYGFIDVNGKEIIPLAYYNNSDISHKPYCQDGIARIETSEGIRYFDAKGKEIQLFRDIKELNFINGLSLANRDGLYGLVDKNGNEIVPIQYEEILYDEHTDQTKPICVRKDGKYGYIDRSGKVIIPLKYDYAKEFYGDYARVSNGRNEWGFVDITGKEVVPLKFDYVDDFKVGDKADAELNGERGIVTKKGHFFSNKEYGNGYDRNYLTFENGFSKYSKRDEESGRVKYGYINEMGETIAPTIFDFAFPFNEGYAGVGISDSGEFWRGWIDYYNGEYKGGLINEKGEYVIPLTENLIIWGVHDDLVLAQNREDEKWGFLDLKGNIVIPLDYNNRPTFSEGIALVEKDGKYGYIDIKGNTIIPFIYDRAQDNFNNGIAKIYKERKYGFIDKTGNEIIPAVYDVIKDFEGNYAIALRNKMYGIIDKSGNEIIPCIYEEVKNYLEEGYVMVKTEDRWGALDKDGNVMVPPAYDKMDQFNSGLAMVSRNGIVGFVDKEGHNTFDYLTSDDISKNNEKLQKEDLKLFVGKYTFSYFRGMTNIKMYFTLTLKNDGTFTLEPSNKDTEGIMRSEIVIDGLDYPDSGTWRVIETDKGKGAIIDFGSWGQGSITPKKDIIGIPNVNGQRITERLIRN